MSVLDTTKQQYASLLANIGRAGLNSLYPSEFEYYSITLELVDSQNNLADSLVFPVMPETMSMIRQSISNQRKTAYGVTSTFSTSFVPFPITFAGTFGRSLKLLLQDNVVSGAAINQTSYNDNSGVSTNNVFSNTVKTGYGVTKVLERIFNRCFQLDQYGLPYRLFLYNYAFDANYLVEPKNFNFHMERASSNMVWQYNIELHAIAPAELILSDFANKRLQNLNVAVLQTSINTMLNIYQEEFNRRQNALLIIT